MCFLGGFVMKSKVLTLCVGLLSVGIIMTGCSGSTDAVDTETDVVEVHEEEVVEEPVEEVAEELTAGELLEKLSEVNENVTEILVWTEETDINGNLGRPNQYTSKADFSDSRVEEYATTEEAKLESGLKGGTIEVFSSSSDCQTRYDYLKTFMDPSIGAFGLNQYMYKYDKVIFRVSYDVVPSEAEVYKEQMDEILGEEGEMAVWTEEE